MSLSMNNTSVADTAAAPPPSLLSHGNVIIRGGRSFPRRLFAMLEDAEPKGFSDIVTWLPDGKSFKVLKPKKFAATIMQSYFKNQTKYKSFQRQLNIYGFQRIHLGPHKGGYEHADLNRNAPELCRKINRAYAPEFRNQPERMANTAATQPPQAMPQNQTFASTLRSPSAAAAASLPEDPFAALAGLFRRNDQQKGNNPSQDITTNRFLGQLNNTGISSENQSFSLDLKQPMHGNNNVEIVDPAAEAKLFAELFGELPNLGNSMSGNNSSSMNDLSLFSPFVGGSQQSSRVNAGKPASIVRLNPVRGMAIETAMKNLPDDEMFFNMVNETNDGNMSDSDFGQDQEEDNASLDDAETNGSLTPNNNEHFFPWKLHRMLEDAKKNNFEHIVSWVQGGAAFKVHDGDLFVEQVMPTYFDQTKYESFRRQLNLYGFSRVSRGQNRGIYFHEFFLESDRRLCRNITRSRVGITKNNA